MKGTTHMAVGMLTSILVAQTLQTDSSITHLALTLTSGAIGGLLPDIDHSGSKLGSKIPILPKLLKHRGITHTVYFIALCAFLLYVLKIPTLYIITTLAAILSHILGDMLTPAGIYPFRIGNVGNTWLCFPILKIPALERGIEIASYVCIMLLIK